MRITLVISVLALAGCSTMFNSGSQTILAKTSNDAKPKVDITTPSGTYQTTLPTTIVAVPSTNTEVSITVVDPCYDHATVVVKKSVTPSYWVNILNGWGFLIDAATGDMWKYDNNVMVPLKKKQGNEGLCS
ncbi:hypothetical protein M9194_02335 [Vibrio sp. S4M6]|uniref:hypothetical protein n=1 Tax=Vibrio sinus TaxID=2946865 RepID=UPI00202A3D31|nr:hypothetical protein [Vibrio sinus]MCL9780269.1 hypothetical protein [Vibrio sinus]